MLAMVFWMASFDPRPISIIAITAATPITIPSIVRPERSLFRKIARAAVFNPRGTGNPRVFAPDRWVGSPLTGLPGWAHWPGGIDRVAATVVGRTEAVDVIPVEHEAASPLSAVCEPVPDRANAGSCGRKFTVSLSIIPSRRRITRPARAPTSGSCVTSTMVTPSACRRSNRSRISRPVRESRLPVGSSASNSGGELTRALAMATRCCCPPDICAGS